ncbi:MAG: hypothetical protein BME94_00090 [Methanobacteriales archaeon Met13]
MKILAVDVGTGTQDIMLYDSRKPIENAVKLVMPSPTRIIANKIRNHHHDLFLSGETMGGGPVNRAIQSHLDKGYRVVMTEGAARTVRDDLEQVKTKGIEIVPDGEQHPEMAQIKMGDIDLDILTECLLPFDVELEFNQVGIAVQDHGYSKGTGDRNFRFQKIREKLNSPLPPEEFAFQGDVPQYFTRMQGVLRTLKGYNPVLMDSKFAALAGCTCDPEVAGMETFVALDIGNGHTLAAAFKEGMICGVFEHHTKMLTPQKIEDLVEKLISGKITHQEVHQDKGHGAWVVEPIETFESLVATGPQRKLLQKTPFKVHKAAPVGDVMMAGPAGLIKSVLSKNKSKMEI